MISGCISEDFVSLLVLHFKVPEDIILFFTSGLDFLGDGVDLMFFGLGGTAGLFGLDKELADLLGKIGGGSEEGESISWDVVSIESFDRASLR
jgi:hypothetical protein